MTSDWRSGFDAERAARRGSARRGSARGGLAVAVIVLGAVAFFGVRGALRGGPPEPTLVERYRADERIRLLLEPCGHERAFEADTSAIHEVLVETLDAGAQLEPLRRAKQDLARMGPRVAEPLRRLFDEASRDVWRVGVVMNVLDVCAIAEEPWGRSIAREGLVSSREDVRIKASYTFRQHGQPEDFEAVFSAFKLSSNPETAEKLVPALAKCDPGLFQYHAPDLIDALREEEGGYAVSPLADAIAVECVEAVDPVVVERLFERSRGLAPRQRTYMIAPSAAAPDLKHHAEALEELRAHLNDEQLLPRQHATIALGRAGLHREIVPVLELDTDPRLRALAAGLVAEGVEEVLREGVAPPAELLDALRKGLRDPDPAVAAVSLSALVHAGDEAAYLETLRQLEGSMAERDAAARVLRDGFDRLPPEAPDQARKRLIRLYEQRTGDGAPSAEVLSILSAIGAVPGRESGEFLLDVGRRYSGIAIRGIDGHRWCVGQAYNAGPEARAVLRERLAVERDPFRRLDLISFIRQDPDPAALELLMDVVADASIDPHERLYAADRLLYMGAADRVAPFLKGAYFEAKDEVLRRGLQCLLWIWYGAAA